MCGESRKHGFGWEGRSSNISPRPYQRRFQAWVNHNVSKHIVGRAKQLECSIAIEDLTGIRERTNEQPRSKTERRRSNSWAFYQLRVFLDYKVLGAGVEVIKVNPAYTSQTCHKCLGIHPVKGKSYRSGKTFKCGHCHWKGDADFNGANVIKLLGLSVNQRAIRSLETHIGGMSGNSRVTSSG